MTSPTATATPLSEELAAVRAEMVRADNLCATMTGVSGVLLALLAPQLTGHQGVAALGVFALSCGLLIAALLVLLLGVMRPRLGTAVEFPMFAGLDPDEIGQILIDLSTASLQRHQCAELRILSDIILRKYQRLRIAIRLTAAAAVVLILLPLAMLS